MRAFEIMRDRTGARLPRRLPYWLADALGAAEELRARLTGRPPLVTRGDVEVFRHDWPVPSADAVRDLGFPVTPLAVGLTDTLAELSAPNRST